MSTFTYGQKEPMENEAMARTLDAQARAIWPQEKPLLQRLFTGHTPEVLDVGCGTGEISSRIVTEFSPRSVIGFDLAEANLIRAKRLFLPSDYPGLSFQQGNAIELPFDENRFDVTLCRHMLQAIPDPLRVDRNLLADIFTHWRDGFEEWLSANTDHPLEDVRARFNDIIGCTKNPDGYAAWLVPSMSARVTAEMKKRVT